MTGTSFTDLPAQLAAENSAVSKILYRLVPFLVLLYILNYLDRVNVSFAKLEMAKDLALSDAVYGFGAAIFFVGYFIFEVPSNLIMHRVGARLWISRIMVSWGIVACAMAYAKSPLSKKH